MNDALLETVLRGTRIIDLGRQLTVGMPQSPNHPQFWHTYPRRHGDFIREGGGSAANDMIVMGTHVGTHIDALAHVSQDGKMFGDADVNESCLGGKYATLGVHSIPPYLGRGVLIDVARTKGVDTLAGGYEITPEDLQEALDRTGTTLQGGDVAIVRSGWGRLFVDGAAYIGHESGVPGVGEAGAKWLAERKLFAAGADTIAFERLAPMGGHAVLPAHRVLLVEAGIFIIEAMDLEALSGSGVTVFTLVLVPMNIYGGTGSPVRPLAVIG